MTAKSRAMSCGLTFSARRPVSMLLCARHRLLARGDVMKIDPSVWIIGFLAGFGGALVFKLVFALIVP